MVPFINWAGAVFKKWVSIEKGAKISGGLTVEANSEETPAILADGDCEFNGNITSVKRIDCKQIFTGDIQAKDMQLAGESVKQRLDQLNELVKSSNKSVQFHHETLLSTIQTDKSRSDVELGKLINQVNADRTYSQDARRAIIAQADKDRADNFTAHESIISKIGEERVAATKTRDDIVKKIDSNREELAAEFQDLRSHIDTNQLMNEDAHKLIMEKLNRYRSNSNTAQEEFDGRLTELESLLSNPDPNDSGLVLSPSETQKDLCLGVRNPDNILKKMIKISGSADSFGDVTISGKLFVREPLAYGQSAAKDEKKEVFSLLKYLEQRVKNLDIQGDSNLLALVGTVPSQKVGLATTIAQGDGTKEQTLLTATFDSTTGQALVGINNDDPKYPLHVGGDGKIENDLQVQKGLFVFGDAKIKGNTQFMNHIYLAGDAKLKGNVSISKTLFLQTDGKVTGNFAVQRSIEVGGDSRFDNDLHVRGNILTYTDGKQDNQPLMNRIVELENELALLKKTILELKKDENSEGSVKNIVKNFYQSMKQMDELKAV